MGGELWVRWAVHHNVRQLRAFQRWVANWWVLHVDQEAMLAQVHRPGEVLQTDGT